MTEKPHRVLCNVCGTPAVSFDPYNTRKAAKCPNPKCQALERHRLLFFYLVHHTSLFASRKRLRLLHVAPEPGPRAQLRDVLGKRYTAMDIDPGRKPDLLADLQALPCKPHSFHFLICSHVLEHINDDRKAVAECYRVLALSGGTAIFMVPVSRKHTDEDPEAAATPEDRKKRYGQHDHVRAYGPDVLNRLLTPDRSIQVQIVRARDLMDPKTIKRLGLERAGELYVCRRPPAQRKKEAPE